MKRLLLFVTLVMGVIALSLPVQATSLVMELNHEFSGATPPVGEGPWLKAVFDDGGTAGSVTLTLEAVGLTDNEFVTEWDFNFNPDLDLASLVINQTNGVTAGISTEVNDFKADGDGYFDIEFLFPSSGSRFGADSVATFEITAADLTADAFNFVSVNGPVGKTGFLTAAHIQGIGPDSEASGWIAPGDPGAVIPEPSTVFLFGIGLLGILGLGRKFGKR